MNKIVKNLVGNKPLIGLLVFSAVIAILNPGFISSDNILNVLRQTSINAIIAVGMTYVILSAGIDLSVGSVLALTGAVAAALLSAGQPLVIALTAPLILGALLGAISGALIGYGKLQPFITTLVTMTFLRGATLVFTGGKPISISGEHLDFINFIGSGSIVGIPVTVLIMIAMVLLAHFSLNNTKFGRYVYAVGGNEEATRLSGINTNKVKVKVYMISGIMAALAGIILTARLGTASPTAGTSYELDAIAAVVLGGTSLVGGSGRISGTLIGALIIGVMANALNLLGVSSNYQMMAKALVILAAVLIDRQGKSTLKMSTQTKSIIGVISAIAFIFALTIFSKDESKDRIGLIVSTQNNPFFVSLKEGAEAEAQRQGLEIIVLNSQDDPVKERANVEDLLVRGVKTILINPVNSDAVGSAIALANEKKVPVITLDRAALSGEVATHIASDNIAGGTMAAEFMVEQLGKGAEVAELQGIAGTDAARDRGEGFHAIADNELVVVTSLAADFDRSKGYNTMMDILQAHPTIKGVFAHNDEMALGALKAIEESGKDILVVGFDANEDAVREVKAGKMGATVAQQPQLIGANGVKASVELIAGKTVAPNLPVDLQLVTKESADTPQESQKIEGPIGLVVSTQNNPFFVTLAQGAQEQARKAGVKLIVLNSQDDPVKERANIEDLLVQGVQAILINPVNSEASGNAVLLANKKGVPVITLDRSVASGEVATHIASDNVAGGELAAQFIVKQLGKGAEVAELQGIAGTDAARDRGEGFHKVADNDLDVVTSLSADFDRSKGYTTMMDILQAHPTIKGVFAHNDEMALGAMRVIKEQGKDIVVVGFDGNDDAVTSVRAGAMKATVAQQPELIGSMGIDAALKLLSGDEIASEIPVDLQLITK